MRELPEHRPQPLNTERVAHASSFRHFITTCDVESTPGLAHSSDMSEIWVVRFSSPKRKWNSFPVDRDVTGVIGVEKEIYTYIHMYRTSTHVYIYIHMDM